MWSRQASLAGVAGVVLGAAAALGGQAALDRFHQTDEDLERAYIQGYSKATAGGALDEGQCFRLARALYDSMGGEYHAYGDGCEQALNGRAPNPALYIEVNRGGD